MTSNSPCRRVCSGCDEVDGCEGDGVAQFRDDLPLLLGQRSEVFADELRRQTHQGALAENSGARQLQHAGVDIGADDLDVIFIDPGQFSSSHMAIE